MSFLPKRSAILVALAFAPTLAFATNGYFQHGYGVKAQGLGGAGIAFAQDGLAAATNPAGTAFVSDRIDAGLTWFSPKRGAEITSPNPSAGSYDGNGKEDFFIPEFGYIKHVSPATTVGVAVYGNGGMNTSYDKGVPLFNGGGTGGKTGINLEQLFISPSIAWQPNAQNSIGAAANIAYQRFKAEGLQSFGLQNAGTDTSHGVGLRLGWTGQVSQDLTLGATWSSKIHTTKFEKYKGLFAEEGGFDIPENYGIGLAYKLSPALTIAADLEEIKYSGVKSVANPLAGFTTPLGASNGPGFGWKDITVYKLGVSYDYSKDLTLRVGINHSDQPIPAGETLFNVLAPGVVQDHLSLGLTWKTADKQEFSVAYTHAFKKTVKGSGSIPAAFGGGEANIHLEENILGVAYSWKL